MKKPASVISPDLLERLAQPDSKFHSGYLAYRNNEINRDELIARLPHVALIGDSVSMGVHVSTGFGTLWRIRRSSGANWFLDSDPSPESVRSVSKRLDELAPFVAREYAGLGAMIDREAERPVLFRRILGTRNFSGQVDELLSLKRFPDLILILIGHNNVDWTWWCPKADWERPDGQLHRQSLAIRRNFERETARLVAQARTQSRKTAIVVYGLINFGEYFKARAEAEKLRARDRFRYPHLETTYKYLNSLRPAYRDNLVRLSTMVNDQLREMVNELNETLTDPGNIQLRYSNAMATADLSRVELLHSVDGWHPSVEGHNVLADAAFRDLHSSLQFLGIG